MHNRHRLALLVLCCLAGCAPAVAAPRSQPPSAAPAKATQQVRSEAEYRQHLQALAGLLASCRGQTDAAHCRADDVGGDDRVTVPGQGSPRLVDYSWLRAVLAHVGDPKHPLKATEADPLLAAGQRRLQLEQSQAPGSKPMPSVNAAAGRATLTRVLERAEFRHTDRSLTDRILDAIALWINRHLDRLAQYSAHRRWLGRLLEWGLVSGACLALALWFLRQTRRARGLLVGEAAALDAAPAMRDWQRWRDEAEQAARQQRWRDAVHGFYWATIARLESRGQWPTDRARTPRESLRLLTPEHPRHNDLRQLTRCFEACWYGADTASEPDSNSARQLFERLVAR